MRASRHFVNLLIISTLSHIQGEGGLTVEQIEGYQKISLNLSYSQLLCAHGAFGRVRWDYLRVLAMEVRDNSLTVFLPQT